nr:hypothetical protein [Tanacetum cinerariifolium]
MSSITNQQTKLDLELVPKENRLDIEKCNGRIPRGLKPREPTFQVVLDTLALTPCYSAFLITADVLEVYMHQFWNSVLSGKTSGLEKLRLSKAQILWGMHYQKNVDYVELLWEDFIYQIDNKVYKKNKIGMHTSKDDYLINTLRFVSTKESTQIYGKLLLETLTSPEMKESKAYKTYLGYASGAIPPKIARKFKKASPSKKDSSLVYVDDETTKKGIELLSEVALAEKSQMKEVRKKCLREFHRTHPSGSGMIVETPPSVEKTKSSVTREGTGNKPWVFDVTKDESTKSESESWGNDEDDSNDVKDSENKGSDKENKNDDDKTPSNSEKDDDEEEDEFAHTPPNTDDEEDTNLESKNDNKIEGDEDRGMNDTTNQFNDDEKENLEITQEQVVEDAHVMILTAAKETEVPDASFSHSSDLASKFLIFLDIHPNDAEIVSPLDVHVHPEVPRTHTSTLLTVSVSLNFSLVCTTFPQSSQTFTSPLLLKTPTPPPTIETSNTPSIIPNFALVFRFNEKVNALEKEQVKNQLPRILPEEVSNFAPPMIEKMIEESLNQRSQKEKDKDEGPSTGSDQGFKKRKTSKDTEPTTGPKSKDSTSGSSKCTKSQPKYSGKNVQSEVLEFKVTDIDMPQNQGRNLGVAFRLLKGTRSNYAELEYDFEECYKALSEKLDWENPKGGDYPFDLTKPLSLVKVGNRQKVSADYFFNNDLKYLQGGISTMTYTTSLTKTKAAHYDLLGTEDMVPNIWSLVKVFAKEKMEFLGKEKSSLHDQGNQQAAEGKKDDAELGKIIGGRLYDSDPRLFQRTI